ncbi:TetR family transcriptional regulator [Streptomyces sp. SBT349]|uniref:acyl-CoA-like ligand-binding transcription factor n=1 Tax=Streptomyces sp. SBT349 TaxID=1580539 RepID=UPI00066B1FEB|nr:TetR family transcriptional regulator [Streptomyces sp. SBT349]
MTEEDAPTGLRERKKRATRAALAEAAVRLAAEHGAEHVTVEAISDAVGVSPRTFFNYFDTRDDAFVMIDSEVGRRLRAAVLGAPEPVAPLDAVRDAIVAELADVEARHDMWALRAQVLRGAPHLLVRSMGAHMADELEMAGAIAERLGTPADAERLGLYPRLLAAVAGTAVRVSVEHWSAAGPGADDLPAVFRAAFAHLAAGLPTPPPGA